MSQQNRENESKLPCQGVLTVFAIVIGIWIAIAVVGWLWIL